MMKKTVWVCPKGAHQARIESAHVSTDNGEEVLKIIGVLTSVQHPLKTYTFRQVYKGKDLQKFIEQFSAVVGEEQIAQLFNMEGELISDGLVVLEGLRVDVEIDLYYGKGHEQPWTKVVGFARLGELTAHFDEAV